MNAVPLLARLGLRWQLFLIVVVGITPVIALLLYDASRDRQHETLEIEREAREAATDVAWQHEQLVRGGQELLSVLARQREVTEGDAAACSALLASLLQQPSRYTMIGAADLGGDVFCSGLPLSGSGINVSDRAYFQRAYSTREFAVGAYQIGRASGKPTLPFAHPVFGPSGDVQAVLFAGLDSGWIAEFATGSELPFDADISVLDRDGAVLAHYPESHGEGGHDDMESVFLAAAGHLGEGTASATDDTGRDRYYAFVPLRWAAEDPLAFVGISFPEAAAFVDIDRALRRNIGALMLVAVVALMAAWWVSARLITRPAARLVGAASRLAAGDLQARSGLPYRRGEMGQLAAAFDGMAGALQARQETVERLSHDNQTILDTAGEGICGVDPQGNVTFINAAGARMLGWEAQELMGKPAHETWHHSRPDGIPASRETCAILSSVRDGVALHGEDEVYWRKDGTGFPVEYTSSPIMDSNGQVTGAVVTFSDITERKRAEAELRQRYHELSALNQVNEVVAASLNLKVVAATAVEAVLWVLELDAGIIRYVDPVALELVALTDHGLPEDMVQQLRAEPRRPVSLGLAGAVARTGEPLIVNGLPGDPRLVSDAMKTSGFLVYIGVPLKVQNEVVGVFSGFSRAQRTFTPAEIGLATSIGSVVGMAIANARLFDQVEAAGREWERTFNTMSEGVAILGPDFLIVRANRALARMLGAKSDALVGRRCYEVMHGMGAPPAECPLSQCIAEKRACESERLEPFLGNRWLHLGVEPVLGPNGELLSVVHTTRDITERKRAEEELVKLRQAVLTSGEVVFLTDREGTITFANPAFSAVYGYSADEVVGKRTPRILKSGLIPPEGYAQFWEAMLSKQVVVGEITNKTKDGRLIVVDASANAVVDDNGNIIGFLGIQRDVTSRKLAEKKLQESEERYRTLAEAAHDAIFVVDPGGRLSFINTFAASQMGCRPDDVIGRAMWEVFPYVDAELQTADLRHVADTLEPLYVERRVAFPEGEAWLGTQLVPLREPSGAFAGVLAIARDMTETKLAEEQVRASLAEKEALLKEVHHRVKNNLQVISSLLDLQAGSVEDERVLHLFREMQNRVRSMALIHEQLYRAPDLARIQFDDFVQTLTGNLHRSWGVSSDVIDLRVNVGPVLVPVDRAVPFGLIINELVSNAFKHAFPGGRHGEVSIDFSLEDGKFSLVVRDNGVGMRPDFDIESARTLGLQLVNALTRQCRGAMEVHSNGGTEFRFAFPA